jgi:hypothetical protein
MAYDAMPEGKTGLMSALVEGRYGLVPIPDAQLGPRKFGVTPTYAIERCRPIYANNPATDLFEPRVVGGEACLHSSRPESFSDDNRAFGLCCLQRQPIGVRCSDHTAPAPEPAGSANTLRCIAAWRPRSGAWAGGADGSADYCCRTQHILETIAGFTESRPWRPPIGYSVPKTELRMALVRRNSSPQDVFARRAAISRSRKWTSRVTTSSRHSLVRGCTSPQS